uniref:trypsin n=1 Tax=Pygocentrus nattereri TaxID=42514 RepID=A0A3B4CKL0_PYGNA
NVVNRFFFTPHFYIRACVKVGIINGTEAKPHSRPYMVSLQMGGRHMCGGFLVSDQFVMTAAHCYMNRPRFTAVLGAHDVSNSAEGSVSMEVVAYYPHQQFNLRNLDYDIMLLKVNGYAEINKNTGHWITLPQRDEDIPANTVCSVAGWGGTAAFHPPTNRLMETKITIIDRHSCGQYWRLTTRMVCEYIHFDNYTPKRCDSTLRPNVYARISGFLPWISYIITRGYLA